MVNLRLKKTILEVVDNQLKANDPPCTKEVYEKLQNAGYSKSEAKDKIGAVVLTEIYDVMKAGKPFDEEKYKKCLERMLEQSINYEDNHHIETEWDRWDDLVQKGYECFEKEKEEEGLSFWQQAWDIFCSVLEQNPKTGTLYGLMDDLDYMYPIEEWLVDYETGLGGVGRCGERLAFCRKVLELFDWENEDDSPYRCGIGESLFREGKTKEAYEYYEQWLAEDPKNTEGLNSFSWILLENGEAEKAYNMIKNTIWDTLCDAENAILFMRGKQMADYLGKEEESNWYQQQLSQFEESAGMWKMNEEESLDELWGLQQMPIVKEKKIYPNDPCPCGSGKKYKKCCGRT